MHQATSRANGVRNELIASDSRDAPPLVHPTTIVEGDVFIGAGTRVGPHCVLTGPLRIDEECDISAHCIIGAAPEHRSRTAAGIVCIGKKTTIREACIVHRGTGQRDTVIGSHCYIMNRVYIAHDCLVADGATISAGVSVGGHATILEGANIGMNASIHQFSVVGKYAMVGMQTPVTKDVPPFAVVAGSPVRLLRVNTHPLTLLNLDECLIQMNEEGLCYLDGSALILDALSSFNTHSRRRSVCAITARARVVSKPR